MALVKFKLNLPGIAYLLFLLVGLIIYMTGLPWSIRSEAKVSLRQLLSVSIDLAEKGGDVVRRVRDSSAYSEKVKGKTKEGANEMFTEGDRLSHSTIYYGFQKAFPGLTVLSEERDTAPVDLRSIAAANQHLAEVEAFADEWLPPEDLAVWIDPLDATQEYTENLRLYVTVMVCVVYKGRPIMGVVHRPFEDGASKSCWAWVGKGSSECIRSLEQNRKAKLHDQLAEIVISRSHHGNAVEQRLSAGLPGVNVTLAGGAGYKTLAVINGTYDAYVHMTALKKWDICAPYALMQHMGGSFKDLRSGADIDFGPLGSAKHERGLVATMDAEIARLIRSRVRFESSDLPAAAATLRRRRAGLYPEYLNSLSQSQPSSKKYK